VPTTAGGQDLAPAEGPVEGRRRFRTFDSLIDVPAYRWYMGSMMGNWSAMQMQQVARGYLAYQVTGSFAALGLVELANTWPRLFLALYGGVLADRASRRVIIQIGQAAQALNAGIIAVLLFTGELQFFHLILASFAQGVFNSFVLPARQAMIPEIVGPERLMNAFALNVFALNTMRLVAPAFAGAVIAFLMDRTGGDTFFSVGVVFAMMACFQVVAVVGLFPVPRTNARTRLALQGDVAVAVAEANDRVGLRDIKEAFGYLNRERVIVWLMVIHSSTAMLGIVYQRLLPGFVETVLGATEDRSAAVMGSLLTVTAFGALLGSLLIASLPPRHRGKILAFSLALFGSTLILFASSTVFWISAVIVFALGIGQSIRQSIANILIQSRVEERFRGRVSAIMLLDDGLESLGVFGIAIAADALGAQWALAAVGCIMIAYAVAIWAKRSIRELD
jgi:MFS family permease